MHDEMKTISSIPQLSPERQFQALVRTIFEPRDLVEIRAIRSPASGDPNSSRVVYRGWHQADELVKEFDRLSELNHQGANIYYGVNPRRDHSGKKSSIQLCRTLWADIDDCSVAEARLRWRTKVPEPSIVVHSGHGVHLYWRLNEPLILDSPNRIIELEGTLVEIQHDIGADTTQDVTRLLRLPGFDNTKRSPTPCVIKQFRSRKVYPWKRFERWRRRAYVEVSDRDPLFSGAVANHANRLLIEGSCKVNRFRDLRRIRGLIRILERDTDDRSKRDYWVVSKLLEMGLGAAEIAELVTGKSKFQSDEYTQLTIAKASRELIGK